MKLFTLLLALSLCAAAQTTMVGLPRYGVTLSGTPVAPQVVNHSGKTIIGFTLRNMDANGQGPVNQQTLFMENPPNDSLLDGHSLIAVGTLQRGAAHPAFQPGSPTVMMRSRNPIVRVELDLVIFADGTSVGADATGSFTRMAGTALLMSQVASAFASNPDRDAAAVALHQIGDWKQEDGLPTGTSSQARNDHWAQWSVASALIGQLGVYGDGVAIQYAHKLSELPQFVKK